MKDEKSQNSTFLNQQQLSAQLKRPPRRLEMSHSDFKGKYIYKIKGYSVNYNLYPLKTLRRKSAKSRLTSSDIAGKHLARMS